MSEGLLFLDGPERPVIAHESHAPMGRDHEIVAWDWNGAGWIHFVIPCPETCRERRKPGPSSYSLGYSDGWRAALSWAFG